MVNTGYYNSEIDHKASKYSARLTSVLFLSISTEAVFRCEGKAQV